MCKIKTTITLSEHIKNFAIKESKAIGLDFSAYITLLIAEKLRGTILIPSENRTYNNISPESIDVIEGKSEENILDDEQKNELNRLMDI